MLRQGIKCHWATGVEALQVYSAEEESFPKTLSFHKQPPFSHQVDEDDAVTAQGEEIRGSRMGCVEFGVLQGCCPCSVSPPR